MRRERPRRAAAGATGDRGGDPGTRGGSRRGVVRTEHFGQKTLLVCMRGTSLCPTGSTGCPWQKARGQRPKCVFLYL